MRCGLLLGVIAYNLGNLLRRLVLPVAIQSWSLTSQSLHSPHGGFIRYTPCCNPKGVITMNVTQYHVLFYGSTAGYQDNRAQIQLSDGNTVLGWIRFHDPGMPFPNDTQSGGMIIMHLPSTMFENVIDVLRNESPINYYFASGHAFLSTSYEPVGEEE